VLEVAEGGGDRPGDPCPVLVGQRDVDDGAVSSAAHALPLAVGGGGVDVPRIQSGFA
ncbi:unnamed protein product, partial [Musa acuminata subsp. burmannicoides]